MESLAISLFGTFQVLSNGMPLKGFRYDKVRALLAYLILERHVPHSRESLIGLLWPDMPDQAARTNLRQAITTLRKALGDRTAGSPYIFIDADTVQWNSAACTNIDLVEFQDLTKEVHGHKHRHLKNCKPCAERLARAVEVYRGDLLNDFYLPDSVPFEEWVVLKREALRRQTFEALSHLVSYHERQGEYEQAEKYALRQLELEPWREEAHRQLMRLYYLDAKRTAALAQYEQCRRVLQEELGVEPDPQTEALYQQICDQERPSGALAAHLGLSSERPHNLPPQLTPFIGRYNELADITKLIDEAACRLISILGPGGIGKTRLAVQASIERMKAFDDGVYFVPLADIHSPNVLAATILAAVGMPMEGGKDDRGQLFRALKNREMLLVIDNFEHMLPAVDLVAEILSRAPMVTLLVTSRERLKLQGEWTVELQGLSVPPPDRDESEEEYDSVKLFLQSAQRANSGFKLTKTNWPHVARICQLLDGTPLAIELAATWMRMLTCEEISREIESNLEFLAGAFHDASPRQRSLQATFDYSWKSLSAEEQAVFRRLAVFRGGCRRKAAEFVTGGRLATLASLLDKSLLRRLPAGRYDLHGLMRQFAEQKLEEAGETEAIRDRHFEYFLEMAETTGSQLEGEQAEVLLASLEDEIGNFRFALDWAICTDQIEQALRMAVALFRFWYWHSHVVEGSQWLETILSKIQGSSHSISPEMYAQALHAAGVLIDEKGDPQQAQAHFTTSLEIRRELGDKLGQAASLNSLGCLAWERKAYSEAQALFEASLAIRRELGQREKLAIPLSNLGVLAETTGDFDKAEVFFLESLQLDRELGNRGGAAIDLSNLGWINLKRLEYSKAEELFGESLLIRQSLGDRDGIAYSLEGFAALFGVRSGREQDLVRAARLFGFTEGFREVLGQALSVPEKEYLQPQKDRTRLALGDQRFKDLRQEGRRLKLDEAIRLALEGMSQKQT